MHYQRVGEFLQQAWKHDHVVWVIRISNRSVDVVSRSQTPGLRVEPIERSILDGCYRLRKKQFQSELSGRHGPVLYSAYFDRSIDEGAAALCCKGSFRRSYLSDQSSRRAAQR